MKLSKKWVRFGLLGLFTVFLSVTSIHALTANAFTTQPNHSNRAWRHPTGLDRYFGSITLLHTDGSFVGSVTRSTSAGFEVYYHGYLNDLGSPVWLWIKLNGRGSGSNFKAIKMERYGSMYNHVSVYRNNPEYNDLFLYAYDGNAVNNWDMELFFVNEQNRRDENYGSHFKGTLIPQY